MFLKFGVWVKILFDWNVHTFTLFSFQQIVHTVIGRIKKDPSNKLISNKLISLPWQFNYL